MAVPLGQALSELCLTAEPGNISAGNLAAHCAMFLISQSITSAVACTFLKEAFACGSCSDRFTNQLVCITSNAVSKDGVGVMSSYEAQRLRHQTTFKRDDFCL
eukprot:151325-Chlamydomonas_euryale.AAC.20